MTLYLICRALGLGARFKMRGNYSSLKEKEMPYSSAMYLNEKSRLLLKRLRQNYLVVLTTYSEFFDNGLIPLFLFTSEIV